MPSVVLTRVGNTRDGDPIGVNPENEVPMPANDEEDADETVVLKWRIGSTQPDEEQTFVMGMTCDIFQARFQKDNILYPGLVVKLVDMQHLPLRNKCLSTQAIARQCLADEVYNFNFAKRLQGTTLPRFAGLFRHGSLYCLVFEDAGRLITLPELQTKQVQ